MKKRVGEWREEQRMVDVKKKMASIKIQRGACASAELSEVDGTRRKRRWGSTEPISQK